MKRSILSAVSACVMALGLSSPGYAQQYPNQPIRLIVSFGPGGGTDIIGRIIAEAAQKKLGQAMVVENRPGAGGTLGNEMVARATPDGYTIGIMTAGQIIAAVMNKSLRYDTRTAFDPIGLVGTAGLIMVTRADYPSSNIKELVAAAKKSPGTISFAAPGFGATQHMSAELFKQSAGVDMLHVPFKTSPEAIAAVLGKQVDVLFDTIPAVLGQVQGGQMKALAVTGKERFPGLPNVPGVIESGLVPGYDVTTWYGFFGPKGMPPAVVERLNKVFNEIVADPEIRERMSKAALVTRGSTPAEFGKFMADELNKWEAVRVKANISQR
jgi:tripartite-type tricarboxylate transporter receptor subunit TctC